MVLVLLLPSLFDARGPTYPLEYDFLHGKFVSVQVNYMADNKDFILFCFAVGGEARCSYLA